MKILFIGAVKFSAIALRELVAMRAELVGICTLSESAVNADHFDLAPIANDAGIPTRYTPNINSSENFDWISSRAPDVIFCFGWSRLIHAPLLNLPRLGVIGFHPAALPANRGRHPIIWALALGLAETASTFFFMNEDADSGDILSQAKIKIEPSDDAESLYARVAEIAMGQIREFVPRLVDGIFSRYPQDTRLANIWRKRTVADGRIDWRMAADSIHNLVRALSRPYVGAHFEYKGEIIKVWRTEIKTDVPENLEPGKVLAVTENGILVKVGTGAILLRQIDRSIALDVGMYL